MKLLFLGSDPRGAALVEWFAAARSGCTVRHHMSVTGAEDALDEQPSLLVTEPHTLDGPLHRWLPQVRPAGPSVVISPHPPGYPPAWWRAYGLAWAPLEGLASVLAQVTESDVPDFGLSDPDRFMARLSALEGAQMGPALRFALHAHLPDAVADGLLAGLQSRPPAAGRLYDGLLDAIGRLGPAGYDLVVHLATQAHHPARVRASAIRVLGDRFDWTAVRTPLEALWEDSPLWRDASAEALIGAALRTARERGPGAESARTQLWAWLEDRRLPPAWRARILRGWAWALQPAITAERLARWGRLPGELGDAARELRDPRSPDGLTYGAAVDLHRADWTPRAAEAWARRGVPDPELLDRAGRSGGPFQRAVVRGATAADGRALLTALAERAEFDPEARRLAVRALGIGPRAQDAPVQLRAWLASQDRQLAEWAVELASELGPSGVPLLTEAALRGPTRALRSRALVGLARDPERQWTVARKLMRSEDAELRAAAFEAGVRATWGRRGALWRWAGADGAAQLARALEGLGLAGAEGLARGLDPEHPLPVRSQAAASLARAVPERWRPDYAERLMDVSAAAAPDTLPSPPAFETEPTGTAVTAVPTGPTAPASPAPAPPPALPRTPEPLPAAPSDSGPPPGPSFRGPQDRSAAPRRPLRSPPPESRPMLSVARARQALNAALEQPDPGYRVLFRLAESSRVPPTVRVQALRHLVAEHPDRSDVRRLVEELLACDVPGVAAAALTGAMQRQDTTLAAMESVVIGSPDPQTRLRALRFVRGRWPKEEARPVLEQALADPSESVRTAALHGLFSSLRYTPADRVERSLINLFQVHEDLRVRVSAAHALGAYGGADAIPALERARGLFGDRTLRDAAVAALGRIQSRLHT